MWRCVFRPKYLLAHVLVISLVVLMVDLGFWQLHRLHGRELANASIRTALAAPATTITNARLPSAARGFSRVQATGMWDAAHELLIRYPVNSNNQPGYDLVVPLVLANGDRIVVNRGWLSLDQGRALERSAGVSDSLVTVVGLLMDSEHVGNHPTAVNSTVVNPTVVNPTSMNSTVVNEIAGAGVTPAGVPTFTALDTAVIPKSSDGHQVASRWIALTGPLHQGDPEPLPLPVIDNGPHLSYALQWFAFSAIAVIGWGILLTRSAKEEGQSTGGT